MKLTYRVMIVEDHPAFVKGLSIIFNDHHDFEIIGTTNSGQEAIKMVEEVAPDLIVMDLCLPDISGLDAIQAIRAKHEDTPILVLSNSDDGGHILDAFEKGATGYLSKLSSVKEIINAAKKAVIKENIMPEKIQKELLLEIQRKNLSAKNLNNLTIREKQVLLWIGEGLSDNEIAQRASIQKGTVRSHVSTILNKLGLQNRSQIILFSIDHKQDLTKNCS